MPHLFERQTHPLAPHGTFIRRLVASILVGLVLIGMSLSAGMMGYHRFEHMAWIDAFVNAAMLLSGMGPLAQPVSYAGKLFAGLYALYSGLAVIVITGVVFAPIIHRALHLFHAELAERPEDDDRT